MNIDEFIQLYEYLKEGNDDKAYLLERIENRLADIQYLLDQMKKEMDRNKKEETDSEEETLFII